MMITQEQVETFKIPLANNKKKIRILGTGFCGFIGSHFVEHLLKETNWEIVILDRLDISGNLERLRDISIWEQEKHRVKFIWWDLKAPLNSFVKKDIGEVDYIWHLAASSHVDRSIEDPLSFVMDNVVGTCNLLNFARTLKDLELFIYFSTDEVFGPAPEGVLYKEWDRYKAGNPYAASKAGAEELCIAFENTYKLPIIVTHTMNCVGERQHPEKFIPMCIRKILAGEVITIHADKTKTKSGSRFWIHARNVCQALLFLTDIYYIKSNPMWRIKRKIKPELLTETEPGQIINVSSVYDIEKIPTIEVEFGDKYNIVGEKEVSNLELAQFIARVIGKKLKYEMVDFHSSRPGHDLRYSLDGTKMKEMGWQLPKTFEQSLAKTIKWYLKPENKKWLNL